MISWNLWHSGQWAHCQAPDRKLRVTALTHFSHFLLYSRGFIHAHAQASTLKEHLLKVKLSISVEKIYLYVIKTWLLQQILIKSSFLFPLGLMQINSLSTFKILGSLFLFIIFSTAQTDYPVRINISINNSPIMRVQKAYFLEACLGNSSSLLSTIV